MEEFIGIFTALIGSLGFSLVFNQRKKHIFFAALGGALSWGAYLLIFRLSGGIFLSSFLASALVAVYSEILARVKKTPASHYLIVGLIPLIPGSSLYYAMSCAVQGEWQQARAFGYETAQYALGIAVGISIVWALLEILRNILKHVKRKKV